MLLNPRLWPWWGWVVAGLLFLLTLLLSAVIVVRLQGQGELHRQLTELRDRGLITLPAELVARAPVVDVARQQRAWDLQQRILAVPWASTASTLTRSMDVRFPQATGGKPLIDQSASLTTDSQTERATWIALTAEGPVVLSAFGWLCQDHPDPTQIGVAQASAMRIPNLLALRALAQGFAAAARIAPDPRIELAGLDGLVEALQPSCSLIDAMILATISNNRDEAWLEATIRGADPTPWIAQRPDLLAAVAIAFAGERSWFLGSLCQDLRAGRGLFVGTVFPSVDRLEGIALNLLLQIMAPQDLAFAYHWEGLIEQRLGGKPVSLAGFEPEIINHRWRHPLSSMIIPNLIECGVSAITQETASRRYRIAAAIVHHWLSTTTIPTDAAGVIALLPEDLLAARGDYPAIVYTVIAPDHFRLATDPATPPSDVLPAGRIDVPKPHPGVWSRGQWWMELDLTKLPAP